MTLGIDSGRSEYKTVLRKVTSDDLCGYGGWALEGMHYVSARAISIHYISARPTEHITNCRL